MNKLNEELWTPCMPRHSTGESPVYGLVQRPNEVRMRHLMIPHVSIVVSGYLTQVDQSTVKGTKVQEAVLSLSNATHTVIDVSV